MNPIVVMYLSSSKLGKSVVMISSAIPKGRATQVDTNRSNEYTHHNSLIREITQVRRCVQASDVGACTYLRRRSRDHCLLSVLVETLLSGSK